jgi:serine/threonine protein phosphatase PrpC
VHESDPISKTTGCTANVVLITPKSYIVANAGDSRSSLCRGGKAIDLSTDHKPESEE